MADYLHPPTIRVSLPSARSIVSSVEHAPAVARRSAAGAVSYLGGVGGSLYRREVTSRMGLGTFIRNPGAPQFANIGIVVPGEGAAEEGAVYAERAAPEISEGAEVAGSRINEVPLYGERAPGPLSRIATYVSGRFGSGAKDLESVPIASTEREAADVASGLKAGEGSVSVRSYASGFGETLPKIGSASGQLVRYGLYGGAAALAGYGAYAGLSYLGGGLSNLGAGLSGLVYGTSGQGGSGGSGGGTTTGSTGGLLSDLTSSPLILLIIVGVGAYLVISHERKSSSSSSGGK